MTLTRDGLDAGPAGQKGLSTSRIVWGKLAEAPVRGLALGLRLGAVLAVLGLLDLLGVTAAIDGALRRSALALRGARSTQQSVVLVAVDDDTLLRWGPPPYGWDRLAPLVAAIRRGQPVVIAFVEPGQRLARGDTPPPEISAELFARHLLVPSPAGPAAQPVLEIGGAGVDRLPLRATLAGEIVERSGLAPPDESSLPVNYLGRDGLPQVSAARVAGDIPAGTFTGKIVLVGVTARGVTVPLATPVGPLAPAQVQAHALTGLTDGVAWRVLGAGGSWLLALLLALAALLALPRLDETRALAIGAGAILFVLVLDYVLFARGTLLLGAARPVAALVVAGLAAAFVERRTLRHALVDLTRELRLKVGLDSMVGGGSAQDSAFWVRVAELARLYLDCRSSIVAELPPDRWHLSLRVLVGTTLGEINEKRRDVRRGAYRRAHLTLNPVWQDDFMSEQLGQRTLLVPLVIGARLLGFWILNFPADGHLDAAHLKLVQTLARQVSLAVDQRQAGAHQVVEPLLVKLLASSNLEKMLDGVGADLRRLSVDKRSLAVLIDGLPFGVLVGTLWGEIRYANEAMRRLVADEGADRIQHLALPEILILLTSLDKDEVYEQLRRMVREVGDLQLTGRTDELGRRAKYQLTLSWLTREAVRPDGDDAEQLILFSAIPTRLAARAASRATDFGEEGTTRNRMVGAGPAPARLDSADEVGAAARPGVTDSFEKVSGTDVGRAPAALPAGPPPLGVTSSDEDAPDEAPDEEPPAGQASRDRPLAELPLAEQPLAEQATAEQPLAEQPPAEQPPAEQPPAEQPPAEQPPAEQPPEGATERVPLADAEELVREALSHGPGSDSPALRDVVDALRRQAGGPAADDAGAHVQLAATETAGRSRSR